MALNEALERLRQHAEAVLKNEGGSAAAAELLEILCCAQTVRSLRSIPAGRCAARNWSIFRS